MNLEERTTLVRNLKPLESRRLIRRTPPKAERGRSLELTEEGKKNSETAVSLFGNRHSRSLSDRWEESAPNCCCNCWRKSSPCKGRGAFLTHYRCRIHGLFYLGGIINMDLSVHTLSLQSYHGLGKQLPLFAHSVSTCGRTQFGANQSPDFLLMISLLSHFPVFTGRLPAYARENSKQ